MGANTGRELLDRVLAGVSAGESPLTHVRDLPERLATPVAWPDWVPPGVREAFSRCGVTRPWAHQIEAAGHAHAGRNVVIATGTASGKSLAYQLPVATALTVDPRATALYLAPTKALTADQLRASVALNLPAVRPAGYDGDTPMAERDWVRAHARWVFTNPDMLHRVYCRHTGGGRTSSAGFPMWSLTSATGTAGCSVRTWRCCSAGCAG